MMRLLLLLLSYAVSARAFFAVAPLSSARGGGRAILSVGSSLHMVKFNGEKWVAEKPEETGEAGYPLMNTWFLHGPKPFFTRIFQPDDYEQARHSLLAPPAFSSCWSSCSVCTTKSPGSVEYMWYILSRHSHYFYCVTILSSSSFFYRPYSSSWPATSAIDKRRWGTWTSTWTIRPIGLLIGWNKKSVGSSTITSRWIKNK
jgi:hypothetical protein